MGVSIQQRNLERFKQLRPISFRLSSEAEHFEAVQIFIFHGSVRKRNHTDAKKGGGNNPILVILKPQHGTLEWIDPIGNEQHSRHQKNLHGPRHSLRWSWLYETTRRIDSGIEILIGQHRTWLPTYAIEKTKNINQHLTL